MDGDGKAGGPGTISFENVTPAQLDAAIKLQTAIEQAMDDAQNKGVGYVCIERSIERTELPGGGLGLPKIETRITALDPETVLTFETPEAALKTKLNAEAWQAFNDGCHPPTAPELEDARAGD